MNRTTACIAMFVTVLCSATTSAAPPADAPFGWMSGHWCSISNGEDFEEHWLPPRGDLALGLSRTVQGGRTTSFEFLRIRRDGDAISYVAQPQGEPPTAFLLSASGVDWARFENPEHDFPTRVEYRRTATGLHAEISGPDGAGGRNVVSFDYLPCTG